LQTGSGTVDPYGGVALGYARQRWGTDWDAPYRLNPLTVQNFSPGSELRLDGHFELKLYPWPFPAEGLPRLVTLSIESNYYQDLRDHANGLVLVNSGSKVLRQNALLQYSALRWEVSAGVCSCR